MAETERRTTGDVTFTCRVGRKGCGAKPITVSPKTVHSCPKCGNVMHEWSNRDGSAVLVCQGKAGYGCGQENLYILPD